MTAPARISLRYDDQDELVDWAGRHLGLTKIAFTRHARAIGVVRDDALVAVAVFDRFSPTNAELSFVSDGSKRWMQRRGLEMVLAYPFRQLGLKRLTAVIGSGNRPAIRAAMFLGFNPEPEGILRGAMQGQDVLIFGMFAHQCPWLRKRTTT